MRMRNFWAQNGPFPQMRIFFKKPVNEPCFFHSCLSTCQKSKSNINLLVKYWQLKNTEIPMVIFSKKSVSVNYIWAPNTMPSFRKTNEPILRKLTNRRKDRQTDGPYFIRLFRLSPGVQQEELDNADLQGTILMDLSKAHGCIPLHTYK